MNWRTKKKNPRKFRQVLKQTNNKKETIKLDRRRNPKSTPTGIKFLISTKAPMHYVILT